VSDGLVCINLKAKKGGGGEGGGRVKRLTVKFN
jgi:hypothetical protein